MRKVFTPSDITLYIHYYNNDKTVASVLEAIFSQTIKPYRILIIDDGSSESLKLDKRFSNSCVVIRHDKNKGLAAARNTAIKNCHTSLVAALDADVLPEKEWLEKMLGASNNFRDVVGIGGAMYERYSETLPDKWRSVHMAQNWGDQEIINPRFLFGCNTLFRKDVIVEAGGYDERLRTNNEDRTLSEKIYSLGYSLLYTPSAKTWHLRQDTDYTILKSYWQWHHAKGLVRGDFASFDGIVKRIEEVNFGIFKYRFDLDMQNKRFDLLKIDLAIPWVFCALDIKLFCQIRGEEIISINSFLAELKNEENINDILSFIQKLIPNAHGYSEAKLPEWFDEYKIIFFTCIKKYNWLNNCLRLKQTVLQRRLT